MKKGKPLAKHTPSGLFDPKKVDLLYHKVVSYIDQARISVLRTVDTEMVKAYWLIGKDIIEEEQKGKVRAEYGIYLLKELSLRLNKKYGKGFSISTLKDIRQFYLAYSGPRGIGHAVRGQSFPNYGH